MPWHIHYATTSSTMEGAAHFASHNAPHLSLITATEQTKGRGRQGKAWTTTPGTAFAGTFIAREGMGPHLPLVISLAVLQACKDLNPQAPLAIKWPNDILKNGQKIAGILVEQRSDKYALIGIGLNLQPCKTSSFASLFEPPFTSTLNPAAVLASCIAAHLHLYSQHGWSAFAVEYARNCATIGQQVSWKQTPTTEISGTAKGLDADGALMLEDENGVIHLIRAGEVIAQAV